MLVNRKYLTSSLKARYETPSRNSEYFTPTLTTLTVKFLIKKLLHVETKEAIPTKEVCWRLDKTGAVGESLLHLCMLNGTKMFIQLAKRLLMHFPKMINDVYLGADYFGDLRFKKNSSKNK